MESKMRYSSSKKRRAVTPNCHIFGVAFNPGTSKWSSFREDALKVLSEHRTEAEAHAACRRYESALWHRMKASPLADLAHGAI
jgi:hypothetical protein